MRIFDYRCLVSSAVLAVVPFCFRANNIMLALFEEQHTGGIFATALVCGMIAACVLLFCSKENEHRERIVALLTCVLGALTVLAVALFLIPAFLGAGIAGATLGFGLALSVKLCCATVTSKRPLDTLLNITAALFLAALITFALAWVKSVTLLCALIIALAAISFLAHYIPSSSGEINVGLSFHEALPFSTRTSTRRIVEFLWGGFFGLAFNYFTIGLTYWPDAAGLSSSGASIQKAIAYAVIFLLFLLATWLIRRKNALTTELLYRIALPVAAAIVLVTPFVGKIVSFNGPVLSSVPYMGIALFYCVGLTAIAWLAASTSLSFSRLFAVALMCSTAAMVAGMLIFRALEHDAQIVSLCVLTAYFVAMMISTIRQAASKQVTPSESTINTFGAACETLATTYGLSPREAEILEFLARGRNSKHIAERLCISPETVRTHTKRIYEKTGVHTKEELLDLIENR